MNNEYEKLDIRIKKWIYQQGWLDLREIQKLAMPSVMDGKSDVLISSSTASGKTEAFFLPAINNTIDQNDGFGILYISPLKALINDQYRRLEPLCHDVNMQVTAWHGDSLVSKKEQAKKTNTGILLITPESLESLLIRRSEWVKRAFSNLKYIAIDEYHSFIGNERGYQLLSLLNRLDHVTNRINNPAPRVALSATLGDIEMATFLLRPNKKIPCTIVRNTNNSSILKIQTKGYVDPVKSSMHDVRASAEDQICQDLYKICKGTSNLIFANSRQKTELFAAQLRDLCELNNSHNEFFPHHGSLSKIHREELEARLQKETLPTTATCTMTLELGIDIGKVASVFQVSAPTSVSSLRQRVGRSGRRDSPSILRVYISEKELVENSNIVDLLRLELIQSLAIIRLLVENKWFEPSDEKQLHLSTLLHQVLAIIGQYGSIRAEQLYFFLCKDGPFQNISSSQFRLLLQNMGKEELITQLDSGELTLGVKGEKFVEHYTFYAVFNTPEEYRVVAEGKPLGTLPLDSVLMPGQNIAFCGKRWVVTDVSPASKTIMVKRSKGGNPPKFGGSPMPVHSRIRQEMFNILSNGDYRVLMGGKKIDFAEKTASELFTEAVVFFNEHNMLENTIITQGKNSYVFPWMGDKVVNTLTALLIQGGYSAGSYYGVIEIQDTEPQEISQFFINCVTKKLPTEHDLAKAVPEKQIEKFDAFIGEDLLCDEYGKKKFDCIETEEWIKKNFM